MLKSAYPISEKIATPIGANIQATNRYLREYASIMNYITQLAHIVWSVIASNQKLFCSFFEAQLQLTIDDTDIGLSAVDGYYI